MFIIEILCLNDEGWQQCMEFQFEAYATNQAASIDLIKMRSLCPEFEFRISKVEW